MTVSRPNLCRLAGRPRPRKEVSKMARYMIPRIAHCSDGCKPTS